LHQAIAFQVAQRLGQHLLRNAPNVALQGRKAPWAIFEQVDSLPVVEAGGLRPIDVGPLARARQLEGLGLFGITLQFT